LYQVSFFEISAQAACASAEAGGVSGVLQCYAVCYGVLQRVAACCSVLQCVVCCSVLQRVAACCNMMQYVGACTLLMPAGALQMRCVAVSVGVDPMAAATHI